MSPIRARTRTRRPGLAPGVIAGAGLGAGAVAGAASQNVTIDFDDLAGGLPPVVTDGLFSDFATFTTEPGSLLLVFDASESGIGSPPNSLAAGVSVNASTFDSDIYVDFTDPAEHLSLEILGDNNSGVVARVRVVHDGGTASVDVVGNANIFDVIPVDLTAFTGVTRVELVGITDTFGLAIDNIDFATTPACPADFDDSGTVDTLDVVAFVDAWIAQGPGSDVNDDGAVDIRDVLAFLALWNAGCP